MPYLGETYIGGVRLRSLPRLQPLAAHADVALSIRDDAPLLIVGSVGVGKTTLMAEVDLWTENVRNSMRRLDREGFPRFECGSSWRYNLWTTAAEYCDDVKAGFKMAASCEASAIRARRLFLDDLGIERDTPQNLEAITALLYGRYARNLPTWVTTNYSVLEIQARYGERVFSRIAQHATLVQLAGVDRRMHVPTPDPQLAGGLF